MNFPGWAWIVQELAALRAALNRLEHHNGQPASQPVPQPQESEPLAVRVFDWSKYAGQPDRVAFMAFVEAGFGNPQESDKEAAYAAGVAKTEEVQPPPAFDPRSVKELTGFGSPAAIVTGSGYLKVTPPNFDHPAKVVASYTAQAPGKTAPTKVWLWFATDPGLPEPADVPWGNPNGQVDVAVPTAGYVGFRSDTGGDFELVLQYAG